MGLSPGPANGDGPLPPPNPLHPQQAIAVILGREIERTASATPIQPTTDQESVHKGIPEGTHPKFRTLWCSTPLLLMAVLLGEHAGIA